MFFKIGICFILFCERKRTAFCLQARAVNSDYILNVLETVKFVFCLQIHVLAECTMNEKILYSSCVYL